MERVFVMSGVAKIDIVSGFLGAGKTTLIKKLVGEALQGERLVLIENEFGDIGIDGGFLKESGIEITEMNSGCICCTLVGDFSKALKEVVDTYQPERILIEPSGVGKLSDVIRAVKDMEGSQGIVLNSCTTVVDIKKFSMYSKNFGEFFNNQIEYAGTIILSRTDDIADEKFDSGIAKMRELNKEAVIITTPWGNLDGKAILGEIEKEASIEKKVFEEEICEVCGHVHVYGHGHDIHGDHDGHDHDGHEHDGHDHSHHHADEIFDSWGIETHHKYNRNNLESILQRLSTTDEYGTILRAKGMLPDVDGKWSYFDMIPGEYEVRDGVAQATGRICVIGSGIDKEGIASLFSNRN